MPYMMPLNLKINGGIKSERFWRGSYGDGYPL